MFNFYSGNNAEGISPVVLYAALGTCGAFILMLVVLAVLLLKCRSGNVLVVANPDPRSDRKNYLKTDGGTSTREKLNPPPPGINLKLNLKYNIKKFCSIKNKAYCFIFPGFFWSFFVSSFEVELEGIALLVLRFIFNVK
jgi:hypothetical protein